MNNGYAEFLIEQLENIESSLNVRATGRTTRNRRSCQNGDIYVVARSALIPDAKEYFARHNKDVEVISAHSFQSLRNQLVGRQKRGRRVVLDHWAEYTIIRGLLQEPLSLLTTFEV